MLILRSRILFSLLVAIASWGNSFSQNVVFSMYDSAPLYLNPAKTGDFEGNWRVASNYRTQGYGLSEPYTSSLISFENHFYYYSQKINIGLIYLNDNSASLSFPLNEIGGSIAQDVRVSNLTYFRLGIQLCGANRQFTLNGQSFPEQYDRNIGGYNSLLPLSESFPSTSTSYIKVNVGATYFINNSYHINFGFAGRQLNRPSESFFGEENRLGIQWIAHAAASKNLGTALFVKPSILYNYQLKNEITIISCSAGFYMPSNDYKLQSIQAGVAMRYSQEGQVQDFGINIGITANNWTFQMNHDFNRSSNSLNMAPSTAVEFSLIYTRPSTEPRVRTISNQRF